MVPGSTHECDFITYPDPTAAATLRFVATHPRGHADFDFTVVRGSCAVTTAAAAGKTGTTPVGTYVLDASSVYHQAFPIDSLLGPLSGPGCAQTCTRAAFAEYLYVKARATDGWSAWLYYLDAHAVTAFALAPKV